MRRVVIIGAGSAGAVLAARLSERPDHHVTLLEAGPDDADSCDVPVEISGPSFALAKELPDRHWPQLLATRADGQVPRLYVRGRGVGGSASINAMVALPGHPDDYDGWAAQHALRSWRWRDVAPWFESTQLVLHRPAAHEWGPVNRALAAAAPSCADGAWLTRDAHGRRVSVSDAYLAPVRARPNLLVRGDALVAHVRTSGRRATAVELVDGEVIDADLVIVSAGAIHSPAVLLRSGIDAAGIGANLHDHPSFPIPLHVEHPAPMGSLPIATLAAISSGDEPDDLQLLPIDAIEPTMPQLGLLMVALMRSRSRGRVRLASDDPTVDPIVEFSMLADERDWSPLQRGIEQAMHVLDHAAFREVASVLPVPTDLESVRASLGDYVHAVGTCAIGTVVDEACRVVGYESLVVCDASVMPEAPRANTHLPTVMIAERVASML